MRSKCDPFGDGPVLAATRYYLAACRAALRGVPFGHCHVVPSRTGLDIVTGRWRRPYAFESATNNGWSCAGVEAPQACRAAIVAPVSEPVVA